MTGNTLRGDSVPALATALQTRNTTHRERIIALAEGVQQLERDLDIARKQLQAALVAAHESGAPLRDIAPLIGVSASTLCRRLKRDRPQDDSNPLDRPLEDA